MPRTPDEQLLTGLIEDLAAIHRQSPRLRFAPHHRRGDAMNYTQLEAMIRMLLDSGDMTMEAARQLRRIVPNEPGDLAILLQSVVEVHGYDTVMETLENLETT